MSAIAQPKPRMTVEDFFAWDGGGHVGKLELVDGVVRAMAPASATHSLIRKGAGGAWSEAPERASSGTVMLHSIELDLAVADVYAGTHLSDPHDMCR